MCLRFRRRIWARTKTTGKPSKCDRQFIFRFAQQNCYLLNSIHCMFAGRNRRKGKTSAAKLHLCRIQRYSSSSRLMQSDSGCKFPGLLDHTELMLSLWADPLVEWPDWFWCKSAKLSGHHLNEPLKKCITEITRRTFSHMLTLLQQKTLFSGCHISFKIIDLPKVRSVWFKPFPPG